MGVLIICELSYTRPTDRFKETSGFDFEYSLNIQLGVVFISSYLRLAQRLIYIFFFNFNFKFFLYVNHIAICMSMIHIAG